MKCLNTTLNTCTHAIVHARWQPAHWYFLPKFGVDFVGPDGSYYLSNWLVCQELDSKLKIFFTFLTEVIPPAMILNW